MATRKSQLLTRKQAAEYLGISASALYYWGTLGEGPKFYSFNGKCNRYSVDDIEAWLATQIPEHMRGGKK